MIFNHNDPHCHARPSRGLLRSASALLVGVVTGVVVLGSGTADATTLGLRRILPRQRLGSTHMFQQPIRLERWTNSPRTDLRRGLRPHSFWVRPGPGRKGGLQHLEKKLQLSHPVRQREEMAVRPGTTYHERPIRGGSGHAREVMPHDRVPKDALHLRELVRK